MTDGVPSLLPTTERRERSLERFRGREIKTTGDGFLAVFDGPARAIRCAAAIRDRSGHFGLEVRCGLHTGEVELTEGDVRGIAVHIGSRIAALAGAGEFSYRRPSRISSSARGSRSRTVVCTS